MTIKVYQYPKCGTCKKALKWLEARNIEYDVIDIVDSPPSRALLEKVQAMSGVPVNKMFNISGQSYRQGGYKTKLETMTDAQALEALAADGKLIKRPIVIGKDVALVGFREPEWAEKLA